MENSTVMLEDKPSLTNANQRQKRGFKLAAIVYLIYGAFVLTIVISPMTLAQEIVPGVSLCLVVGPSVIVSGILLALWAFLCDPHTVA